MWQWIETIAPEVMRLQLHHNGRGVIGAAEDLAFALKDFVWPVA
jgi:tRNA(Ile2) C34 agmatinyltransferase TiaS